MRGETFTLGRSKSYIGELSATSEGLAGLQQFLRSPFLKTTSKVSAFRTFLAYRYHTELNGENQLFQLTLIMKCYEKIFITQNTLVSKDTLLCLICM